MKDRERLVRAETLIAERERQAKRDRKEIQRRLGDLNHAHEQARETLGTYLPRETWEAWLKEEQQRREKIDDELAELRSAASNAAARAEASVATNARNLAIASVVIAIVVLIANGVFG